MESLPLIERQLGIQMEYIPDDLITIIMPTHNHEDYIEETLESLVHHLSGKRSIQVQLPPPADNRQLTNPSTDRRYRRSKHRLHRGETQRIPEEHPQVSLVLDKLLHQRPERLPEELLHLSVQEAHQ